MDPGHPMQMSVKTPLGSTTPWTVLEYEVSGSALFFFFLDFVLNLWLNEREYLCIFGIN